MSSSPLSPSAAVPQQPAAHPGQARVIWKLLTHFEHSRMVPSLALRNTAGVVIPLVVGFALGMPRGGLAMASGALNVSYSDGHDPYPQRARRMLASTAWCAIAIFLGAITGHRNIEAVFVATAWAFIAGMLVAVGTTAADVGVISLVLLVVYAAQPLTPRQAAEAGALALCGGLLQTALSIALWPVRRYDGNAGPSVIFFSNSPMLLESQRKRRARRPVRRPQRRRKTPSTPSEVIVPSKACASAHCSARRSASGSAS